MSMKICGMKKLMKQKHAFNDLCVRKTNNK